MNRLGIIPGLFRDWFLLNIRFSLILWFPRHFVYSLEFEDCFIKFFASELYIFYAWFEILVVFWKVFDMDTLVFLQYLLIELWLSNLEVIWVRRKGSIFIGCRIVKWVRRSEFSGLNVFVTIFFISQTLYLILSIGWLSPSLLDHSLVLRPFLNRLYHSFICVMPIISSTEAFCIISIVSVQLLPRLKQNMMQIRWSVLSVNFNCKQIRPTEKACWT